MSESSSVQTREVITEFRDAVNDLMRVRMEVNNLKESMEGIARIVRGEGTSNPSLLTTIALLTKDLVNLQEAANTLKNDFNNSITSLRREMLDYRLDIERRLTESRDTISAERRSFESRIAEAERMVKTVNVEDTRGKWTIITAVVSLIGTLIVGAIAAFKH